MSSSDLTILMSMGFSKIKAEKALQATGNNGVNSAVDWLLLQMKEEELVPESSLAVKNTDSQVGISTENKTSNNNITVTKSFKCDSCNKLFNTNLEIEFHASKSGHAKFSESNEIKKELSADEKKLQLQLLEYNLKQKRKNREEMEQKEILEKEKNRIRSGKEITEAKKKLEELEIKRMLEVRKREKEEDRIAREKIKMLIEADKMARKSNTSVSTATKKFVQCASSVSTSSRLNSGNQHETKLQIRLTDGQTMTQTFGSKEQLSAVRLYIELNRTDDHGPFILMTSFPKKIFTENDYDTPLDVLGLIPSAAIIVQKTIKENLG